MKALIPDQPENNLDIESHILSSLDCPGIPRYVEAFCHKGVGYLVQELVDGYPLSYYIAQGRLFTEEEARQILFQLLEILVYLHEPEGTRCAVIHRDLRLSNLLWSEEKICMVDFGCARYYEGKTQQPAIEQNMTEVKMNNCRPGTRPYTFLRKEISPRSDLFGAGVVGLDLFTNWIEDKTLFLKPWQEILPASNAFKALIETLLNRRTQSMSAADVLKRFRTSGLCRKTPDYMVYYRKPK